MSLAGPLSATRPKATAIEPSRVALPAIVLAAMALQLLHPINTDVAWLMTVCERILDGARPYRDVIETNPPGSVLLYLPAVLLGRALGVAPEIVVVVLVALAALASLRVSAGILRGAASPGDRFRNGLLVATAAVLLLLPAGSYGQREHVILIVSLPLLAALAARSGESRPPWRWLGAAAALGAGVALAIKPYYGLGMAAPLALVWWRGGWRAAAPAWELWLAVAIAGALGVAQVAAFPDFRQTVLPLLLRVYVPAREPLVDLLASPSTLIEAAGLSVFALLRRRRAGPAPVADTAALASLGFLAAAILQGKGWPYHALPALASLGIGIAALLCAPDRPRGVAGAAGISAAAALALVSSAWLDAHRDTDADAPGLAGALHALGPHPKLLSLSTDIAVAHPLVRQVGGRWTGTLMSSWISMYVARITGALDRSGPLGADLAFEDRTMAHDIEAGEPDAVLGDHPASRAWFAAHPAVEVALRSYRETGPYGSVTLWTRKGD